jgi:peroxiredoxin
VLIYNAETLVPDKTTRLSMRSLLRALPCSLIVIGLILAGSAPCVQAQNVKRGVAPAAFGQPFPPGEFGNLNVQAGGPPRIDLAQELGKRPVLLFYWIAGNPRADEMFKATEALVAEVGADKVALFGVALPQPGRGADVIATKLAELKIGVPVLDDQGFEIGQRLRVQTVPSVAIIDGGGKLRLANGAWLTQELEYRMTVETAIRRVAQKGTLGNYGYLPPYYPVMEMVGRDCPDFEARPLSGETSTRWHAMLDDKKLNALVFWSIDCPHCRRELPRINEWLKANPGQVNVVSVAKAPNNAVRVKTEEYCNSNELVFPTLIDVNNEVIELFQVSSTPTTLLIRPDGVIDSVLTSTTQDFARAVEKSLGALESAAN